MDFWKQVAVDFVGNVLAGFLLLGGYILAQWFLSATDITIGYAWKFDGTMQAAFNIRPCFDIRNRSRSKTYYLANIGYLRDTQQQPIDIDNKSVWGIELKPGTITHAEAAPVKNLTGSLSLLEGLQVHVYLQNGRQFWLRGTGLGALKMGRIQRVAFWLRKGLEAGAVPME
jgi:hypothetical protein